MEEKTPAQLLLNASHDILGRLSAAGDGQQLVAIKAIVIIECMNELGEYSTVQVATDSPLWSLMGLLHVGMMSAQAKLAVEITDVIGGDEDDFEN